MQVEDPVFKRGYWVLGIGYWMQDTGCMMHDARYWSKIPFLSGNAGMGGFSQSYSSESLTRIN